MLSSKNLNWHSHLGTGQLQLVCNENQWLLEKGGRRITSDFYVLNKITHHWDVVEQILSPRVAPVVVSMADTIIVIGRVDDNGQFTNTVWIGSFNP